MRTKTDKSQSKNNGNSPFIKSRNVPGFFNVQPKLKVGQPGDKYEQEADRVADEVMRKGDSQPFFGSANPVQTKSNTILQEESLAQNITPLVQCQEEEEEAVQPKQESLFTIQKAEEEEAQPRLLDSVIQKQEEEEETQMQPIEEEEEMLQTQPLEEEEELQTKAETSIAKKSVSSEDRINGTKGDGNSLDTKTRTQMESSFGAHFGGVKIHTDNSAVQLNKELGAQAFTRGNDIYFNEGKYNPDSQNGKKLLAHELTHTVQQGGSPVQPYIQREVTSTTSLSTEKAIEKKNETCDEATLKAKKQFVNHGIYGPQSTTLEWGGFDSAYYPLSEILDITVRGKTKFVDGLSVGSSGFVSQENDDLNELAGVLNYIDDDVLSNTIVSNYYSWSEEQKNTARGNFEKRLQESTKIWEAGGKLVFKIDEPCWEDIEAKVDINVNVKDEGEAKFKDSKKSKKDHLQVKLVKNPERNQHAEIEGLISDTAKRVGDERKESIATSAELTTTANVSYDNQMTLTNFDLQDSPNEKGSSLRSMLRHRVFFGNTKSDLDKDAIDILNGFANEFKNGDNIKSNNKVVLYGYASKSGSTAYNTNLVNKRLASVYSFLTKNGITNIESRKKQINYSDIEAEKYDKKYSEWFRRVELVVGSGELQNTVTHELGHVFKLEDEYVTPKGEDGSGTARGEIVGHNKMAEDIGVGNVMGNRLVRVFPKWAKSALRKATGEGVRAEASDNIMSMGNEVKQQHYGSFGKELSKLTGKIWRIFKK